MALKRDQNQIAYEDRVSKYWPEFSKNGKEDITIQDVLRHDSGLNKLQTLVDLEWTQTNNIKKNVIGKLIENEVK